MIKALSLFLLFLPVMALSQNITGAKVIANYKVAGRPNFFFKVNDAGNLISFSRSREGDTRGLASGTNHILDIESYEESNIPGPYDPVFFPLSELMIFRSAATREAAYEIFQVSELMRGNKTSLSTVPNLTGYYQSTGLLKIENGIHYYRVITENHTLSHQVVDFSFNPHSGKIELTFDQEVKLLCPNIKIKLPMLSKDGHMLGGLDLSTQTSAVWRIKDDLSCDKILDLGIKTGKLNFNYSGDKLTYHLYRKIDAGKIWDDQSQNYVGVPEDTFVSDIFIYDLIDNVVSKISSNYANNSMYPDFTRDGRVVFISHPHDQKEASSFVFVRVKESGTVIDRQNTLILQEKAEK